MNLKPLSAPLPYDAGVHIPTTAANRHTGKMEGLPHHWPKSRAGVYRGMEKCRNPFRDGISARQKKLLGCRFATFRGTSKGTVATLTDSRIFSITSKSGTGTATTQQQTRNGQATTNHTDIQNVLSTIHTHTTEQPSRRSQPSAVR